MSGALLPHGWPEGLPDPDTGDPNAIGWWQQCARHRLVMPRCRCCGTTRFPPLPNCHRCLSVDTDWADVGPGAEIYSYNVAHYPVHPSLRDVVPYTVVVVTPDGSDGERMIGNLLEAPRAEPLIGRRVRLVWEDIHGGYSLPQWELDSMLPKMTT